ncbi:hypothetical protein TNCV_937411 [Trichonephila clavipes]|nr:hypothetical protein TNCV_937411 [Trichonephila clavipes]
MRGYRETKEEVTLEKQKIELAKTDVSVIVRKRSRTQRAAQSIALNPAAKVEDKQFETNIENMIKTIRTLSLPCS